MNKKLYLSIFITLVFIVLLITSPRLIHNSEVKLQKNESVVYSSYQDIDNDGKNTRILITRTSPEPLISKDKLYLENKINNPSTPLAGSFSGIRFEDINNNGNLDLIIYSTSGQLVTVQVFQYLQNKIFPVPFQENSKDTLIWASTLPDFIDLNNDGKKEIIFTHILIGEKPTEKVEVKDFYRLSGENYEKYKEEKKVIGNNFAG